MDNQREYITYVHEANSGLIRSGIVQVVQDWDQDLKSCTG